MPIPPNNTARSELRFTIGGELAMCVQHWTCTAPPVDQTETDALAAAIGSWGATILMPILSSDLVLDDVIVSSYLGGGLAFQSVFPLNQAGGDVAESIEPNQVAAVITWRTATPDKSGRGRSFIPGLGSSRVQLGSDIAPATLSDLQDAADDLIGLSGTTNWALGVWSRTDALVRDVVSAQARSIVRTQKRRLPRN